MQWSWLDFNQGNFSKKICSALFIQWLTSVFKGKWPTGGPVRERDGDTEG